MDLLFNELSIHKQFSNIDSFCKAIGRIMTMRTYAKRFGREISCESQVLHTRPIQGVEMREAIMRLPSIDQRRAILAWLNRTGPFWNVYRSHGQSDWLECRGEIVTDFAVGEAAFRKLSGVDCALISIKPSNWMFSPIVVVWKKETRSLETAVINLFTLDQLKAALEVAMQPIYVVERSKDNRGEAIPKAGVLSRKLSADGWCTIRQERGRSISRTPRNSKRVHAESRPVWTAIS